MDNPVRARLQWRACAKGKVRRREPSSGLAQGATRRAQCHIGVAAPVTPPAGWCAGAGAGGLLSPCATHFFYIYMRLCALQSNPFFFFGISDP